MGQLEAIAEAFNVTNGRNFDVSSVLAVDYLTGPPTLNQNKNFATYSQTLSPREIQLGLRLVF